MTYPDGRVVSYQTYVKNQVRQVRVDGKLIAEYDYLGENVLSRRLSQAGIAIDNSFDTRGRVTAENFRDINVNTNYTYKANTDLISNKTIDSTPQTYGYDDLRRLTSYNAANYSLDDIGNNTQSPSPGYNYYVDVENRITDVNDLSDSRIASYGYDAFGRRNKKTLFDENGSPVLITYFVYDIMGNVITEYEQTTGNISWAKDYIYGGQGELVSLHLPRTAAMNAAFDNLMSFATAWLCYPNCTTQELTWDTNSDDQINLYDYAYYVHNTNYFDGAFLSNIYYCLTDKNNSVVGIIDIDRDVEYITYNAWGTPSYTGDIQGLSVLWNGYYFDAEVENYYLRNRYYSPLQRKFLTDDPHGIIPDGNWNNPFAIMNQYADGVGLAVYAGANPVMNRDDWGLMVGSLPAPGIGGFPGTEYPSFPTVDVNSGECGCTAKRATGNSIPHETIDCGGGNRWGFSSGGNSGPGLKSPEPEMVAPYYYWTLKKRSFGSLKYGSGERCKCADCGDIKDCLNELSKQHQSCFKNKTVKYHVGIIGPILGIGDFEGIMPYTCQQFVSKALESCCLKKGRGGVKR